MRMKNSIPQDREQWQGHDFVVVNFWPRDHKVPQYDGRNMRPTAICTNCGVVHWRGRKMGTFGRPDPEGRRRSYVSPADCGEAYLPLGTVPTWRKGHVVGAAMSACVPTTDEALLAALEQIRVEDAAMDDIVRQQDELSVRYEDQWEKLQGLANGLILPMVPALAKAARSASAKKAAATLRSKVAK